MAKSVIELFEDYYAKELRTARSNEEAFIRAVDKFEQEKEISAPPSYDAFRMRRYRKKKTR